VSTNIAVSRNCLNWESGSPTRPVSDFVGHRLTTGIYQQIFRLRFKQFWTQGPILSPQQRACLKWNSTSKQNLFLLWVFKAILVFPLPNIPHIPTFVSPTPVPPATPLSSALMEPQLRTQYQNIHMREGILDPGNRRVRIHSNVKLLRKCHPCYPYFLSFVTSLQYINGKRSHGLFLHSAYVFEHHRHLHVLLLALSQKFTVCTSRRLICLSFPCHSHLYSPLTPCRCKIIE